MEALNSQPTASSNSTDLITNNIDIWTSAIKTRSSSGRGSSKKLDLYGIKKLRELILELAVRGKLVAQDPNDEAASVLLERIAAEKAQLVKAKKIKKPKVLSAITEDEKAFERPHGWSWVTLSHLGVFSGGKTPSKMKSEYWDGSIPWVTPKDMKVEDISGSVNSVTQLAVEDGLAEIPPGALLFVVRSGILRRHFPVAITKVKCTVNQDLKVLQLFDRELSSYVRLMMKGFESYILQNLTKIGTTVESLKFDEFSKHYFIIPPLSEQHRIVAKVDELMALCDQLEQQTETSIDAHATLIETLLTTLTNSTDAAELEQNWHRLADHFDTLFTTEHSIDQLKQTILQLAVMGKLVPQEPNDEPAAVLLEKIAAEKEQLVKEKKIKKQKPLPPIDKDDKPFVLPTGWEWCRLDDICYGITSGSTPSKEEFRENSGVPYLKVYNIRAQAIDFEYKPQFVHPDYHLSKLKRSILYPGDVVMNIVGPPLGKVAVIPDIYPEWNCNQAITFFRPIEPRFNTYIYTYLKAGTFLRSIELIGTAGQDNISVTKSRSIVLPVPPLNEQHRIVSKVDQLMTLCDQLKARLQQARQTQLHLADALVEKAVR